MLSILSDLESNNFYNKIDIPSSEMISVSLENKKN